MKGSLIKRALAGIGVALGLGIAGVAAYVMVQTSRFAASMDKVYDRPLPAVARSTEAAVVARGKHLVESIAACTSTHCHGPDLAGGAPLDLGPVGTLVGPNITGAGLGIAYSDAELARLITYGVKKDGRSVQFMPVQDFGWLPLPDIAAMVSYVRTVPPIDRPNGATVFKTLGRVLDRRDEFIVDVARRLDHTKTDVVPSPAPTAEYGAFVARLCTGCHGDHFGGGPIPGAPPSLPVPRNLTPDATGLEDWTFDDFERLMRHAVKKDGKPLDPFMPTENVSKLDDLELHALWLYLRSLPPAPFGSR